MPVTREQVVDYLSALSPEQLRELILELEDLWSIERPATNEPRYETMGMALHDPHSAEWSVILLDVGSRRIEVMRTMREYSNRSLSDVKALVDGVPSVLVEQWPRAAAEAFHDRLVALGARARLELG